MGKRCAVCVHKDRLEIDKSILRKVPHKTIASQYKLRLHAVQRHANQHIHRQLITATQSKEFKQSLDILDEINELLRKGKTLLERAEDEGKLSTALRGIGEVRGVLELFSKLGIYWDQTQRLEEARTRREQLERFKKNLSTFELEKLSKLLAKGEGDTNVKILDISPSWGKYEKEEEPEDIDFDDKPEPVFVRGKWRSKIIVESREKDNGRNLGSRVSEDSESDAPDHEGDGGIDGPDFEERDLEGFTQSEREAVRPRHEIAGVTWGSRRNRRRPRSFWDDVGPVRVKTLM